MLDGSAFHPLILWARSPLCVPTLQDQEAIAFAAQFYFDETSRD